MKIEPIIFLSSLPVLAAGAGLFYWQTLQLQLLTAAAPAADASVAGQPLIAERQGPAAPPATRQMANETSLADKLEGILLASTASGLAKANDMDDETLYHSLSDQRELTEAESGKCWEAVLARKASWQEILGASLEERKTKGAEIEARFEATLASIMGDKWAAARKASKDALKQSTAEFLAATAVSRVNEVVPLTPAQKDALHAAILARGPTNKTLPRLPHVTRFFSVVTRPEAPRFDQAQLSKVLTEDEVKHYTLLQNSWVEKQKATTQLAMQSFMPALIAALKEEAKSRPADPAPTLR